MHIKIALTGKMRAGKDTVFRIINETLNEKVYAENDLDSRDVSIAKFAFGDSLKYYAQAIFPEKFVEGKKPRALLQGFGQGLRELNPDVWIQHVDRKIKKHDKHRDLTISIITDLRQPNEYEYCKTNGFYIIKVVAPDEVRMARMTASGDAFNPEDVTHDTESYVDGYRADFTINNNVSLPILETNVSNVVKDILRKSGMQNELHKLHREQTGS